MSQEIIVGLQLLLHVGIGYHNITGLLMELTQTVTLADSLGDVESPSAHSDLCSLMPCLVPPMRLHLCPHSHPDGSKGHEVPFYGTPNFIFS